MECHDVATLQVRVVIDCDVVKTRDREKAIRDSGEQIVCDDESVPTPRLMRRVVTAQLKHLLGILDGVVRKADVFDSDPRRRAFLAGNGKQNCVTNLRVSPAVFEDIAVDDRSEEHTSEL